MEEWPSVTLGIEGLNRIHHSESAGEQMGNSYPPNDDLNEFWDKDKVDHLIRIVEGGKVNIEAQVALRQAEIDLLAALQAAVLSKRWRLFDFISKRLKLMEERRRTREALKKYLACDFLAGEKDANLIAEVSRTLADRP
jgi:hypothetical protein